MVEQSRRACSAVANGEADCAIIGGDVPDELAHVLKVGSLPPLQGNLLSQVHSKPLHHSVFKQVRAVARNFRCRSCGGRLPSILCRCL